MKIIPTLSICFLVFFLLINTFGYSLSEGIITGYKAFCAERQALDSAEKQSVEYLKRLSHEASLYYRNGLQQVMRNQIDAGIKDYLTAIEMEPENPALYDQLSIAYDRKGDLQKAIESSLKALEIDPAYSYAHLGLAVLYDNAGKVELAKEHAAKHLRLSPDSKEKATCLKIINK